MVVLDRSSTMQAGFSGSGSRQLAVQTALNDTIATFQGRVKFGLELFPGDANGRAGGCAHSSCCAGAITVEPLISAQTAISPYLLCSDQQGCQSGSSDSPSNKALEQVQTFYSNRSKSGWGDMSQPSTYVLLITASEPACSSDPTNAETCRAKTPATSLANLNIPVVVLTVGYDPSNNPNSCLVQLSNLGSVALMPNNTWRLNTPPSYSYLRDTLFALFAAIARKSCTFTTTDVIPDYATPTVTVGSVPVTKDDPDGWAYDSVNHSQITLSGKSCDQYLFNSPGTTVSVSYTCSTCAGPGACNQ
jgi:hypothetical protein